MRPRAAGGGVVEARMGSMAANNDVGESRTWSKAVGDEDDKFLVPSESADSG